MTHKWGMGVAAAVVLMGWGGACKRTEPSVGGTLASASYQKQQLALFAPLPAAVASSSLASEAAMPARVALGRRLYYETLLSEGHDVSCNSCHPLNAYGADGRQFSFGHKGQLGGRNAPTVYNAAGGIAQFWDGRAPDVEAQAKGPILNPAEMGMPDSGAVLAHLNESPMYRSMFKAAFPSSANPMTYDNVGRAIGAFERGLVTPSRWDRYLSGDTTALTAEERAGFGTFVALGCQGCHNGAYVGGGAFQKAGLVIPWMSRADSGRYAITHNPSDVMVFKVPSLRNVAMTAPYFHDGSVASLPEAVRLMALHQLGRDISSRDAQRITVWLGSLTGEIPVAYIAEPPLPH